MRRERRIVIVFEVRRACQICVFGVAKATEQKLTERTLFTQYATMVGTLEYMSPEQAEMSALAYALVSSPARGYNESDCCRMTR